MCSSCQRSKSEHDTSGSRSGSSAPGAGGGQGSSSRTWRRRSEPDPNSNIAGVRISALASKFQGREARSGSIAESVVTAGGGGSGSGSVHERAKTLGECTWIWLPY